MSGLASQFAYTRLGGPTPRAESPTGLPVGVSGPLEGSGTPSGPKIAPIFPTPRIVCGFRGVVWMPAFHPYQQAMFESARPIVLWRKGARG